MSVVALNTLYMNQKNNATNQGTEGQDQLNWLAENLSKANGRKFIITNHIYPGAKYDGKAKDSLFEEFNSQYFDILD